MKKSLLVLFLAATAMGLCAQQSLPSAPLRNVQQNLPTALQQFGPEHFIPKDDLQADLTARHSSHHAHRMPIVDHTAPYDFQADGIYYRRTAPGEVEVMPHDTLEWSTYSGTLVIPASVEHDGTTYTVTGIANGAFTNNSSLREPLTDVTLPPTIRTIGDGNQITTGAVRITDLKAFLNIDFAWTLFSGENVTLYLNDEPVIELFVPDGVTEIKPFAFYEYAPLREIHLPASVKRIGQYAFCGPALYNFSLPEGIEEVGLAAFSCSVTDPFVIPASLKKIEPGAFALLTGFSAFDVAAGNTAFKTNGEYLLSADGTVVYATVSTTTADYYVPDGVSEIAAYAYYNRLTQETFTLPASVRKIGSGAFANASISTLNITDLAAYVSTEMESASSNPRGYKEEVGITLNGAPLTQANISEGVESIAPYAFYGYGGLKSVNLPSSLKHIGHYAFTSCHGLKSVSLPNGLKTIGNYAFADDSIASISIPASVESIGVRAFSYNPLTSLTVAAGNASYTAEANVLYDKSRTQLILYAQGKTETAFTVPATVKVIKSTAFSRANHLTDVTLPPSVEQIETSAFTTETTLKIHVSDLRAFCSITSRTADGMYAWCNSFNLYLNDELVRHLEVPEGVTNISRLLFAHCRDLESVSLPETLESLEQWAFGYMPNLRAITLPRSLQQMEFYALSHNPRLRILRSKMTEPIPFCTDLQSTSTGFFFNMEQFINTAADVTLYVPEGTAATYSATPGWQDFAAIVETDLDAAAPATLPTGVWEGIDEKGVVFNVVSTLDAAGQPLVYVSNVDEQGSHIVFVSDDAVDYNAEGAMLTTTAADSWFKKGVWVATVLNFLPDGVGLHINDINGNTRRVALPRLSAAALRFEAGLWTGTDANGSLVFVELNTPTSGVAVFGDNGDVEDITIQFSNGAGWISGKTSGSTVALSVNDKSQLVGTYLGRTLIFTPELDGYEILALHFDAGHKQVGDYTYSQFWSYTDLGLTLTPVDISNPAAAIFQIGNWGGGVDFKFIWDMENNEITVPEQFIGYTNSTYGDVYVQDCKSKYPSNFSQETAPCYYDASTATFHFNVIYFVSAGYFGYGDETFTITGEEATTAIKEATANIAGSIRPANGGVDILGPAGETAFVYTPDGRLVRRVAVSGLPQHVSLPANGLYIVRMGTQHAKVRL